MKKILQTIVIVVALMGLVVSPAMATTLELPMLQNIEARSCYDYLQTFEQRARKSTPFDDLPDAEAKRRSLRAFLFTYMGSFGDLTWVQGYLSAFNVLSNTYMTQAELDSPSFEVQILNYCQNYPTDLLSDAALLFAVQHLKKDIRFKTVIERLKAEDQRENFVIESLGKLPSE